MSPDGFRSGRKSRSVGRDHRLARSDDLIGEVESRLLLFAFEFHWTPTDVWALQLDEFCMFADFVDEQVKQRKKAASRR